METEGEKNLKDINFVICSFDKLNSLQAAIESIIKYTTGFDYCLTIMYDVSDKPDSAKPLYQKLVKSYDNIQLVPGTDNLILTERNLGCNSIPARYHVEMDDDVLVQRDCIRHLYDTMERDPTIGIAVPLLTFRGSMFYLKQVAMIPNDLMLKLIDNDDIRKDLPKLQKWYEENVYVPRNSKIKSNYIEMFELSLMMKSEKMKPLGCFDWDEYLDIGRSAHRANEELMLRMDEKGMRAAVVNTAMALHCHHGRFKKDPRWGDGVHLASAYFHKKVGDKIWLTNKRLGENLTANYRYKWKCAMANMPRGCPNSMPTQ